jgi:hypothetical protein
VPHPQSRQEVAKVAPVIPLQRVCTYKARAVVEKTIAPPELSTLQELVG